MTKKKAQYCPACGHLMKFEEHINIHMTKGDRYRCQKCGISYTVVEDDDRSVVTR